MKTQNYFTSILTALALTFALTVTAQEFTFDDEEMIDDIPFDTEMIAHQAKAQKELASFKFEDEQFINDIPFDTEKVVEQYNYKKAVSVKFSFPDETSIDDIPFDTHAIVNQMKGQQNCCPFVVAFTNDRLF